MTHSSTLRLRGLCALLSAALLTAPLAVTAQSVSTAPAAEAALALRYVRAHAAAWGLAEADVQDVAVQRAYTDAHNGVRHAYLRQRLGGKDVLGAEMGLHFDRNGALLARTGQFVAHLRTAARTAEPALSAAAAQAAAERQLQATAKPATAQAPQLVYVRQPNGTVQLAWQTVVKPSAAAGLVDVLVDAQSGEVLLQSSRRKRERAAAQSPVDAAADEAAPRTAALNAYRVFPVPVESPGYGPRAVSTNPADALASPFGWHDTNGAAGAEYTTTRGNNAYAYIPNPATGASTYTADGGSALNFDFPLDLTLAPVASRDAALTNAFYWINLMHDVTWRYGFTEAAGNFQATNYTGQGLGGDPLTVWTQDPSAENNAYYQATPDGPHPTDPNNPENVPIIGLGLYDQEITTTLSVSSGGAPTVYSIVQNASYLSPQFSVGAPATARLVLVNTLGGVGATSACSGSFSNAAAINGNFAVVDPLDCQFADKVLNVQAAGARAVLFLSMINNPNLGLYINNANIRIPCIQLGYQDSQTLLAQLRAGQQLTGTALATQPPARDVAFDNGVVAHEFMHGVSVRLTGGGNIRCLDNKEQMGEGWSDFLALWATTRPGDRGETARGASTWPIGQPVTGLGIRRRHYSTDMSIDPATYAEVGRTVNGATTVHAIGFVWCSALWDLNWALIQRYGYDANLHTGTGGNNKALQLIIDGLKLQPCSPGFLDGRDAILAADRATFGGAHQALIWQVFARRGMGYDAVQGSSDDLTDNRAGFALPPTLATRSGGLETAALDVYPNPAQGYATVRLAQARPQPVQLELVSALGQTVRAQQLPAAEVAAGARLDVRSLAAGVYVLRLATADGTLTRRLVVQP